MERVFKDEALQRKFEQDGYVKFKLLGLEQVEALRQLYEQSRKIHESVAEEYKMHSTSDTNDTSLLQWVDEQVKAIVQDEIAKHFMDYKLIISNFIVKEPGADSILNPHQDWNFTDETQYFSIALWMPVVPTNAVNGNLQCVKGSHRFRQTLRVSPGFEWEFEPVRPLLNQNLSDEPTELGECIAINHSVIHGSRMNRSNESRVAAILGIVPQNAQLYHYFWEPGQPADKIEQFAMTPEAFYTLKKAERPADGKFLGYVYHDYTPVTEQEMKVYLRNRNPQKGLVGRLKEIFQ